MPEESAAGSCMGACVLSLNEECVSENSHRGSFGWHGAAAGGCCRARKPKRLGKGERGGSE